MIECNLFWKDHQVENICSSYFKLGNRLPSMVDNPSSRHDEVWWKITNTAKSFLMIHLCWHPVRVQSSVACQMLYDGKSKRKIFKIAKTLRYKNITITRYCLNNSLIYWKNLWEIIQLLWGESCSLCGAYTKRKP